MGRKSAINQTIKKVEIHVDGHWLETEDTLAAAIQKIKEACEVAIEQGEEQEWAVELRFVIKRDGN
jgi:hypothetical protein